MTSRRHFILIKIVPKGRNHQAKSASTRLSMTRHLMFMSADKSLWLVDSALNRSLKVLNVVCSITWKMPLCSVVGRYVSRFHKKRISVFLFLLLVCRLVDRKIWITKQKLQAYQFQLDLELVHLHLDLKVKIKISEEIKEFWSHTRIFSSACRPRRALTGTCGNRSRSLIPS